jgi:hypothetical protein
MSFVKKFNEQLDRFIGGLIETFPDLKKLSTYRTSIFLIQKANARKPVEMFREYVLPHKIHILNENQEFFLNHDYGEEDGGTENTAVEAMQFKELWSKSMTEESRKNVFKHLKLLCMLAEKCN